MTKKDKIILAVAFSVIVALFVLIIVNSAVISGLSSEVSVLKDSLSQAESTYAEVLAEKNAYLDSENLFQIVGISRFHWSEALNVSSLPQIS